MSPRVVAVEPLERFHLRVRFTTGEVRVFDASPYLSYPAFEALRVAAFFALARAARGTVCWPNGVDFCPDTVYLESTAGPIAPPLAPGAATSCGSG